MAMQSVKQTWDRISDWVYLGIAAIIAFNLWGFFKSLGDAAKSGADAVLGGLKQDAEDKADKAKAKAAGGNKMDFTTEQTNKFKADAESLANMLGRGKGIGMVDLFKDQAGAFSMLKNEYSRLLLHNNAPYYMTRDKAGKATYHGQTVETSASIKRAYNWRVLAPFYKDYCGHDLLSDFRYYVTDPGRTKYFKWIL